LKSFSPASPASNTDVCQQDLDCPSVVQTGQITIITAARSAVDLKKTANEVLLYRDGHALVSGVLSDGKHFAYVLKSGSGGDRYVGRQLTSGERVMARYAT
jgi:hypothetical protein